MRAVGIETDEVIEGVELPSSDVVVATVGVDLEVVDVAGVAEERDGVVSGQLDALADYVGTSFTHHLKTLTGSVTTDTTMKPAVSGERKGERERERYKREMVLKTIIFNTMIITSFHFVMICKLDQYIRRR